MFPLELAPRQACRQADTLPLLPLGATRQPQQQTHRGSLYLDPNQERNHVQLQNLKGAGLQLSSLVKKLTAEVLNLFACKHRIDMFEIEFRVPDSPHRKHDLK